MLAAPPAGSDTRGPGENPVARPSLTQSAETLVT
jgi:hypothetical protein